jgi:hypothetical protein
MTWCTLYLSLRKGLVHALFKPKKGLGARFYLSQPKKGLGAWVYAKECDLSTWKRSRTLLGSCIYLCVCVMCICIRYTCMCMCNIHTYV